MKKQNLLFLAIISLLISCQPQEASNYEESESTEANVPSIEGVWEIVEGTMTSADTSYTYKPYRSIIMYTDDYYSVEIVNRNRTNFPDLAEGEERSCDDICDAYNGLTSNSGTYMVKGDTLYTEAIIAKNPNFMNEYPKRKVHFVLEGDKLTINNTRSGGRNYSTIHRRLN